MQTTSDSVTEGLVAVEDKDAMPSVVLAAAINGDPPARQQLPLLMSVFREPYRTVAAVVSDRVAAGLYLDRHILASLLQPHRLLRATHGESHEIDAEQVVNLIFSIEIQPGQVEAYLKLLQERQRERVKAEIKCRAVQLAGMYCDHPDVLLAEFAKWADSVRNVQMAGQDGHPSELLEMIPHLQWFADQQRGLKFLGLDSGFQHVNHICNGLDTGLMIVAAPPGRGKTTLLWQLACQTAEINNVPVLFVSMEQSKQELRAKALARLAKLEYRHLLRGGLRVDDPSMWPRVLEAATRYATMGRFLTIIEGDDKTTIDEIASAASTRMASTGSHRCLIAIDYLQLLPLSPADTDRVTNTKDRIDLHVSALRRMARRLDSPVIAISAENRAGYDGKSLNVFKETGAIEYLADIAMVLTRSRQDGPNSSGSEYRLLDLNVIKNRNGERGVVKFKFYAKRAEFVETGKEALVDEEGGKSSSD